MKLKQMSEEKIQQKVFIWASSMVDDFPEILMLNGSLNGVRLTPGQAMKAKKAGMKAGFPDINLPVMRGCCCGLYIELKTDDGGTVSPDQLWWQKELTAQGYLSIFCSGYDECIDAIESYLKLK